MIRVVAPKTEAPDTSGWTEADWDRAMLATSLQMEEEKKSGFIDDPAFTKSFPTGCQHPKHHAPQGIVIPVGKLYRHVCPGCKATSHWKEST